MKKLLTITLLFIMAVILLAACDETPTVAPPEPTATATPAPPEPTPPPIQVWLLECKEEKCPLFAETGVNDSGVPILGINTGTLFYEGYRLLFYYPCQAVDGGEVACEVYKDMEGDIYKEGYWIWKDQLKKVY